MNLLSFMNKDKALILIAVVGESLTYIYHHVFIPKFAQNIRSTPTKRPGNLTSRLKAV